MTDLAQSGNVTPPRTRPSAGLIVLLLFPVLGLIAAGIVIATNSSAFGGAPATPIAVTLAPPKAQANQPEMDFTLTSTDNQSFTLSDYKGRIVFLNFWATWCTPCQKELPALEQFQAQQSANGAVVLALDVKESPDQVKGFLSEYSISGLNILLDSSADVANTYGVFNLPVTFVIDPTGMIRYPHYGAMTVDDLNSYITALKTAS
ncbi:MAG TPA: TlpA disulfide reductase family protein [Phototrophicaceae bacterium]|nr:TlpA disulfide reductase family protein [Phototrophicaceae bacterium]